MTLSLVGWGEGGIVVRTFSAYALPQLRRELELLRRGLEEVDVHVEAAADAVGDWGGEGGVSGAFVGGGGVGEGFAVGVEVAGRTMVSWGGGGWFWGGGAYVVAGCWVVSWGEGGNVYPAVGEGGIGG